MSQLAFNLDAPTDPFKLYGPLSARVAYARAPITINWKSGSPDTIPDHVGAIVLPGTSKRADLTAGVPYVLFTYQGAKALYLAYGDSVSTFDTLLPGGSLWGILAWLDRGGIHDWQQT